MSDREAAIRGFLDAQGWGAARRRPLAGDASFRRYERLHQDARRAVLMDAPPEHEDVRPFLSVDGLLRGLGYSAPRIYGADPEAGLVLIEDLGDETYTRALAKADPKGPDERGLYRLAVDLLIDLHRRPLDTVTADTAAPGMAASGMASGIPPYDDALLRDEAALFIDWYWPALHGQPAPAALRAAYLETWTGLFPAARRVGETLVLRDYHVDNLMLLAGRPGLSACGLLDFQDAVRGPVSYDLVSLLEDARRDVPAGLVRDLKARYLAAFPGLDRAAFEASYAILGAQRNCKIIGIFTRLARRDGKPDYLAHIPRLWRLLEGDLAHPAMAPLRAWLDTHLPPADRRRPPCQTAP